jgi:dephospho-CoA kinase
MNLFIFVAPSASGKTTISKAVSEKHDLPRIDIHRILHDLATQGGYPRAREWVMSIGLDEVLNLTRIQMLEEIEANKNPRGIIIDEIIEGGTFDLIKNLYPESDIKLIYIQTNQENRIKFISKRISAKDEIQALEEILFIDHLKKRLGIDKILERAEIRICNDGRVEDTVDEVCEYVHRVLRNPEGSVKRERE